MAKAGNVSWEQHPDHKPGTRTLYEKVFSTGEKEIITDTGTRQADFTNPAWLIANGLRSYACFPITFKAVVLGTLSLYTGYKHVFDDAEISFHGKHRFPTRRSH